MQKLIIEPTKNTPEIIFSPDDNIFLIKGVSSPEDVRALYYPVIEWVNIFIDDIMDGTLKLYGENAPVILKIDLSYFNSSSAKFLYDILSEMKRLFKAGVPFIVEWYYDNEDIDMKEAGTDMSFMVEMDFNFVAKSRK